MEHWALDVEDTHVHATYTAPEGRPVGAALLVHGFNSDQREFGPLARDLGAHGLHVLAWDQRGFGQSGGERGLVDLPRVVQEADAAMAALQGRSGVLPVGIVGHSLGAALACGLFAEGRHFAAAVLAHPVRRLLDEAAWWQAMPYHVVGRLNAWRHARGHANLMIPNPVTARDIFEAPGREAPFLSPRMNLGTYRFGHEMDAAAWARHVFVPVLGITSPRDRTVRPRNQERVFEAVAGPVERLEHEAGHSLFLDEGGKERCRTIAHWLARRLGEA